jgi:chromosomal replication initiator protein
MEHLSYMAIQTDPRELWQSTLASLEAEVTRPVFDTFLRGTSGYWASDDHLVVTTPNPFVVDFLEQRMYSTIKRALELVSSFALDVSFAVDSAAERGALSPKGSRVSSAPRPVSSRIAGPQPLVERYTFDTFVVGKSNQLAHAASLAVSEKPGISYNPLFLYSSVGLGKSHLLHAIGQRLTRQNLSVLYVTAEQFTNEFIKAIREGKTELFRDKYRNADALLLDDIQFISGKEQTQEGFFHTFNELHNANCQIVLTSDRPPKALSLLEQRLTSRFEWGLTADIQPPDIETRIAILQNKADAQNITIDTEAIEYIALNVTANIRELEGTLNRVMVYASIYSASVSLELTREALPSILQSPQRPDPEQVLRAVASHYSVPVEALISKRRDQAVVLARQVTMYILKESASISITDIGRLLGGRARSSVLHGHEKISRSLATDSQLSANVRIIKEGLRTLSV